MNHLERLWRIDDDNKNMVIVDLGLGGKENPVVGTFTTPELALHAVQLHNQDLRLNDVHREELEGRS